MLEIMAAAPRRAKLNLENILKCFFAFLPEVDNKTKVVHFS